MNRHAPRPDGQTDSQAAVRVVQPTFFNGRMGYGPLSERVNIEPRAAQNDGGAEQSQNQEERPGGSPADWSLAVQHVAHSRAGASGQMRVHDSAARRYNAAESCTAIFDFPILRYAKAGGKGLCAGSKRCVRGFWGVLASPLSPVLGGEGRKRPNWLNAPAQNQNVRAGSRSNTARAASLRLPARTRR